ncbi:L,D-transpeptidase family protein [Solimonas sp. SE-A11]|uniref:L,D-transpeptidase family protein n=1 Tax=Solimonas sp. SE-A11 TaxID=3054954 RepID=UPI00259D05B6|nr:L,D-transpeptidase family protein [Solimonas sp. SE-A11]MDM4771630.1 L,D-transpeptidase family protein [Solimonas sp. SE-A11]
MPGRYTLWIASLSALAAVCFTALGASFLLPQLAQNDAPDPVSVPIAQLTVAPLPPPPVPNAAKPATPQRVAWKDDGQPIDAEWAFGEVIKHLEAGQAGEALSLLQEITHKQPGFIPARPVHRQLLAASEKGAPEPKRLAELAEEARIRLDSEKAMPPEGTVPNAVLQLPDSHKHLLVTDLQRARLYVFENSGGKLKLLRHHYAAMGKNGAGKEARGDNRTPIGIYHITRWLKDEALPELYGAGAWPTNYPNPWDSFKRRTGHGIWLHGVPRDTESRAPRSSEGCVTMANDDLLSLSPYIDLGDTPVVLSNELEWVTPEAQQKDREEFAARVESWRARWSAKDTEGYLAFYGPEFTVSGMNLKQFTEHKKRVNAGKKSIDVKLSNISLYRYPGAGTPLLLAEFEMDYRSDNFNQRSRKQQFWKQDGEGVWKIFREENL